MLRPKRGMRRHGGAATVTRPWRWGCEGVDTAHDAAGETAMAGMDRGWLVVVPGLDPAAEVVGGAVHRGVAGSHARRLGRVVRLLNDHDGGGPHEPDCETEEEVGNGADQVAIGDRLALFGVEDVVLGIPVVELECAIDELAGAERVLHADRVDVDLDILGLGGGLFVFKVRRHVFFAVSLSRSVRPCARATGSGADAAEMSYNAGQPF